MAKHDEAHVLSYPMALAPEKLGPAEFAHQPIEIVIGAYDHGAALVKDGKEIAQRTATAVFPRDLGGMQGVDAGLGARKGEPAEGVEPVVQAFRPRVDAVAFVHPQLVAAALKARGDEAQRSAAFGSETGRFGGAIQCLERALDAEPGAHGIEDWMS